MAKRNSSGRKKVDSCAVVLIVGASLLAGLGYLMSEAVRWLV